MRAYTVYVQTTNRNNDISTHTHSRISGLWHRHRRSTALFQRSRLLDASVLVRTRAAMSARTLPDIWPFGRHNRTICHRLGGHVMKRDGTRASRTHARTHTIARHSVRMSCVGRCHIQSIGPYTRAANVCNSHTYGWTAAKAGTKYDKDNFTYVYNVLAQTFHM